jgi:hypothetical protein
MGEHEIELREGVVGGWVPFTPMVPPDPETGSADPSGRAPFAFSRSSVEVAVAVLARVAFTTATTPLGIVLFEFEATQIIEPPNGLQLRFLPALVRAAPAAMFAEATVEGYVSFHARLAGAVVALNVRFNDTDPPGFAELDARVNDCPNAARLLDSSRSVTTNAVFRCLRLIKNVM